MLLVDINIKAAESVAALIATRFPNVKAIAVKTDVGVEKEIKEAVDLAVKEFGRLDVMVCVFPFWRLPTCRVTPPPPPAELMGVLTSDNLRLAVQQRRDHAPRRRPRLEHRGEDLGPDHADQRQRRLVGIQIRHPRHEREQSGPTKRSHPRREHHQHRQLRRDHGSCYAPVGM